MLKMLRTSTVVTWSLLILWTVVLCVFLLWPSNGTVIDTISEFFGGTDQSDALGHFILAFVEAALLYYSLQSLIPPALAFRIAIIGAVMLGVMLELAQLWIPARGLTPLDLTANLFGVGLFGFLHKLKAHV